MVDAKRSAAAVQQLKSANAGDVRDVTNKTLAVVYRDFPRKLEELDALLKSPEFDVSRWLSCRTGQVAQNMQNLPAAEPSTCSESRPKNSKKRQRDEGPSSVTTTESTVTDSTDQLVSTMIDRVRVELVELLDHTSLLQRWIQKLTPEMGDGNNHGVVVQQMLSGLAEIAKSYAEDQLESISKYWKKKAELSGKVTKHRKVLDMALALVDLDVQQMCVTRDTVVELQRMYSVRYDIIVKNLDKILKPQSGNDYQNMY